MWTYISSPSPIGIRNAELSQCRLLQGSKQDRERERESTQACVSQQGSPIVILNAVLSQCRLLQDSKLDRERERAHRPVYRNRAVPSEFAMQSCPSAACYEAARWKE
jgi:hypothetical protein